MNKDLFFQVLRSWGCADQVNSWLALSSSEYYDKMTKPTTNTCVLSVQDHDRADLISRYFHKGNFQKEELELSN